MKAILIDPNTQTVKMVDCDGSLADIYRLLDCHTIECPITYPNGDVMYCNEEGWLEWSETNRQCGFWFQHWTYAILGKALIIGSDDDGEATSVKIRLSTIANNVQYRTADTMQNQGVDMGLI